MWVIYSPSTLDQTKSSFSSHADIPKTFFKCKDTILYAQISAVKSVNYFYVITHFEQVSTSQLPS